MVKSVILTGEYRKTSIQFVCFQIHNVCPITVIKKVIEIMYS